MGVPITGNTESAMGTEPTPHIIHMLTHVYQTHAMLQSDVM